MEPAAFTYDGTAKEPAVVVKDGETVIAKDEYTVEYVGNVEPGTATVRIIDVPGGAYDVSGEGTFVITREILPTTEATTEVSTESGTESTTAAPVESTTFSPLPTQEPTTEVTTEMPVVQLARVARPKAKNLKNGISLTWKAVENAKAYEVYRKKEGGKLRKLGSTDKTSFVDSNTYHGVKYKYYVRAKSYVEDGISYVTGGVSKARTQYFVKRSGKVKVSAKKGTISWIPTKNIDGYQLLVANNKDMKGGKKFTVGNVNSINVSGITLPSGTYYIALRQYLERDGKRYVSAYHGKKKYTKN